MMNETGIGTIAVCYLAILILYGWFWMYGGRDKHGKYWRRYIGSGIFSIGSTIINIIMGMWNPIFLGIFPATMIGSSLGYGADTVPEKILRRSVFCLGNLATGLMYSLVLGGLAWIVFIIQTIIASTSIILGVRNPLAAPAEEVFVCILLYLGVCMYPFLAQIVK